MLRSPLNRMALFLLTLFAGTGCLNQVHISITPPDESNVTLQETTLYELSKIPGVSSGSTPKSVLLIPIEGEIMGEKERGGGAVYPGRIQRLFDAAESTRIDAIVIKVSSPGGSASASDTIYRMIRRYAIHRRVPVFVHVEGLCASGGYYISMAGSDINAAPVALVGSIGVIIRTFGVQGLMEKVGVEYRSIQSGKNKDILSPFREMTDEQKESLQKQIDQNYETFLAVIRSSRGKRLPDAVLRKIADGNIYNAEQAKQLGLIDSVQPVDEYIVDIASKIGASGIRVFSYLPEGRKDYNIYNTSLSEDISPEARMLRLFRGGVFYLWEGGLR